MLAPSDFPCKNAAQMGEFRVVMGAPPRENRGPGLFSKTAHVPFGFCEALIFCCRYLGRF